MSAGRPVCPAIRPARCCQQGGTSAGRRHKKSRYSAPPQRQHCPTPGPAKHGACGAGSRPGAVQTLSGYQASIALPFPPPEDRPRSRMAGRAASVLTGIDPAHQRRSPPFEVTSITRQLIAQHFILTLCCARRKMKTAPAQETSPMPAPTGWNLEPHPDRRVRRNAQPHSADSPTAPPAPTFLGSNLTRLQPCRTPPRMICVRWR